MKHSVGSLPDWLDLNLKELDPVQKGTLYWNIVFPGAGFAYAGDSWRLLIYGGGAMVLLMVGILSGWAAVHPEGLTTGKMLGRLVVPIVLLLSVVAVHAAAIFASTGARVVHPSPRRAVFYIVCCLLLAGTGMFLLLWEIWLQVLI